MPSRPFSVARSAIAFVSAFALLFTNGCSLFNPHVTPSVAISSYQPADTKTDARFTGGIGEAIDYVNAWRKAYYDAVGEQSMMKNGITLAVVPAAAVAAYFGITGNANRDVIAGLATGGAGLLGLGTFFESKNRQKIYLSGYRAMGCILFAAGPLLMEEGQFKSLTDDLKALDDQLDDLDQKTSEAEAARDILLKLTTKNDALDRADVEIAAAKALSSSAATTSSEGKALARRIASSRLTIETAAGNVASEVSDQIVDDESTLASLESITGGLAAAAQRITTIPPPKAVPDLPKATGGSATKLSGGTLIDEKANALDEALDKMREAGDRVTATARRVHQVVTLYGDIGKSLQDIQGCGFEKVDLGIKIFPADLSVTLPPNTTKSIMISGGKRPYSAALTGQVPDGVTLSRIGFDVQPVVAAVTATSSAKPGEFDLAIQDSTGIGGVMVHFKVPPATTDASRTGGNTGSPTSPASPAAPASAAVKMTDYEAGLTEPQRRVIQYAVGLRGTGQNGVDGVIGTTTRDAIKKYQLDPAHPHTPANGEINDDAQYAELAKIVVADWAAAQPSLNCPLQDTKNIFECTLMNAHDLTLVQTALGMASASGKFDTETRNAISAKAFNPEPSDRPADKSQLSPHLVMKIRNLE